MQSASKSNPRSNYCAALWCNNCTGVRLDERVSFFSLPKEVSRAKKWIQLTLREDLVGRNLKELKNLRLFSDHFHESCYRMKYPKPLLTRDAVPSLQGDTPSNDNARSLEKVKDEMQHESSGLLEMTDQTPKTGKCMVEVEDVGCNAAVCNNIVPATEQDDLCKQHWNNLRDAYRRQIKKNKKNSGQCAVGIKKWKYEDQMSFLSPFLKERETISSMIICESEDGEEVKASPAEVINEESAPIEENFLKSRSKRKHQEAESASSVLMNFLLSEKKSQEEHDKPDDIDLFFASITKTVKKFSPLNKAFAKARVFEIISDIEIKQLSASPSQFTPPPVASPFSTYSCP